MDGFEQFFILVQPKKSKPIRFDQRVRETERMKRESPRKRFSCLTKIKSKERQKNKIQMKNRHSPSITTITTTILIIILIIIIITIGLVNRFENKLHQDELSLTHRKKDRKDWSVCVCVCSLILFEFKLFCLNALSVHFRFERNQFGYSFLLCM